MANDKVCKFIDVYADELEIDNEIRGYLKELIHNLVRKYEGINVDIKQDNLQTYIINPNNIEYSLDDFFINRLFHNVVQVRMEDSLGKNIKGYYKADSKTIKLSNEMINNQIKFSSESEEELEKIKAIARKKVIMHEFEHGMQATFSEGKLSNHSKIMRQNIIKKISAIDDGMFDKQINKDYDESKLHGDEMVKYMGFSKRDIHLHHKLLLEIFNESECLDMANAINPQCIVEYKDGNQFYVYNAESSNCRITNYGYMLKALLGKNETFEGMYFNPEKIMDLFEQRYGDIIESEYRDLTKGQSNISSTDVLETVLKDIKISKDEEKHLKLNTVLAKCLERNIEITKQFEGKEELNDKINVFKKYLIKNSDKKKNDELTHNQILKQIENNMEISEQCENPELLNQYWKNGVEKKFESQIEEVYWEDVLDYFAVMQIGDKDVNNVIKSIGADIRMKKALIYDLTGKSAISVDNTRVIPNLKDKINSLDGLFEIINSNDNFRLKDLMYINNSITKFENNSIVENDRIKIDFVKDKFNYICESKQKEAILNLSKIYKSKKVDVQSNIEKMKQVEKFVPPNMQNIMMGKALEQKCDIYVNQGLKRIFQLLSEKTFVNEDSDISKKEEFKLRAERVMKLTHSNYYNSSNEVDWDRKWRFKEDEVDEVVGTVQKSEFNETTNLFMKDYKKYKEPESVEIPNKEGEYDDWD